jgi:nitroreductase/dihydropteridine reductase
MEFKDVVKNRRSIRQYQPMPVRDATIHELLEIIGMSVSAMNLQPWKIVVIRDQETKDKIYAATFGMNQVRTCSHLLILCADVDHPTLIARLAQAQETAGVDEERIDRGREFATNLTNGMTAEQRLHWSQEQVYIALGNAVNGAYSLGLGACPMTAFNPAEVAKLLELPETLVPTAMVCVGYSAEPGAPKLRYPVDEILVQSQW